MVMPVIPMVAFGGLAVGTKVLHWYYSLAPEQRPIMDRKLIDWVNKMLEERDRGQAVDGADQTWATGNLPH